jgi:hypothetical protein
MREIKSNAVRLMGMVAIGSCLLAPLCGTPTARADSFNITNTLLPGAAITGWPTNSEGANGMGVGVGNAIEVNNQEWAGFWFTGYVVTNTGTINVTLLRSYTQNPPQVVYGTNVWSGTNNVLIQSDWETYSNTLPPIQLSIPINTTNQVTWFTNLDRWVLGGATWVGIGVITNNSTGCLVTNAAMGLNKKIIPIRFP